MRSLLNLAMCLMPLAAAVPSSEKRQIGPIVQLNYATVIGSSVLGVDSFKGIPYAQPPVGPLRLKPPQAITKNLGVVTATGNPRSCPQFLTSTNSSNLPVDVITQLTNTGVFQAASNAGEDCLTINVQRPSSATAASKLPVVFWIFGGGFEFGSTQTYDASEFLATASAQKKDFIYVAVNYRVGAFGWLAGQEILKDGSSNLGLLDQRLGLQWVADNIAKFGGDPSKVTIWGESAGSISCFNQMALYGGDNTYKGKPLFRGAIMDSGSVVPADPVNCKKAQDIYNVVVVRSGCSGAANTLACLRTVDYPTFLAAANSVPGIFDYQSVALSYLPRPDGKVLTQSPELLAISGKFAKVPFIIGDQEDEGTLFSLTQTNITTTKNIVDYLQTYFFFDATRAEIQSLVDLYPDDPTQGSPFRTGVLNNIYPQYKRLAALLGDTVFTLTRRVFLHYASLVHPSVPSWSYLATYNYGTPILGTFHASDILVAYGYTPNFASASIQNYYANFIINLDPNVGSVGFPVWPKWSDAGRQLVNFEALAVTPLADTFREKAYQFLVANATHFHI